MTAHVRALPDFRSLTIPAGGRDSIQVIGGEGIRGVRLRNYTAGKVYWSRAGLEFGYVPADFMHPINFPAEIWELGLRAEVAGQVTAELAAEPFIGESPQELGSVPTILQDIHDDVAKEATLATRASEANVAKEATLATRAAEATLATRASDVVLAARASEATLATRAAEATLGTRGKESTLEATHNRLAFVEETGTGTWNQSANGTVLTVTLAATAAQRVLLQRVKLFSKQKGGAGPTTITGTITGEPENIVHVHTVDEGEMTSERVYDPMRLYDADEDVVITVVKSGTAQANEGAIYAYYTLLPA